MNSNEIKNILISFATGLGLGVLGGKIYYEKKYRMKLKGETFKSDEKTESLYQKENKEEPKVEKDPKESSEINKNKEDLNSMAKKVMDESPRVDYSTPTPSEVKHASEPEPDIEEEFEIEPDDFGERGEDDYETITVLYLADNNLVYENGNAFDPVEAPQKKIGSEALRILKNNPESDVIYVRNKRLKIDYEIIRDDRTMNEGVSDNEEDDDED